MRIGIDAKWIFTGPVSTRVILQNLLPVLLKRYPGVNWIIFLDKKDRGKPLNFDHQPSELVYVPVPNNMLANLFILPYYARKMKLDLVVSQTFPAIKRGYRNISFIYDVLFEEYPQFFTWKERMYFLTLPWFARHTDKIIVNSSSVAKDLLKYKYAKTSSQVELIPLGVGKQYKPLSDRDPGMVQAVRRKFNLPPFFILFVGRLNARKNIEALLRAIPLLNDQSIQVVIVGKEDWKEGNLKEIIRDPVIGKRVMMTGEISEEELVLLYSMATIFCFPSFAEGFGLPPLEAMASGVPVVVSNTTSMPEVCGDAALYIDPHRPDTISSMINQLLQDKDLFEELRRKGMKRSSGFTWEATAAKLMETIKSVVKK